MFLLNIFLGSSFAESGAHQHYTAPSGNDGKYFYTCDPHYPVCIITSEQIQDGTTIPTLTARGVQIGIEY